MALSRIVNEVKKEAGTVDAKAADKLYEYLKEIKLPATKNEGLSRATRDADWFIALLTVGLFATAESSRTAKQGRDASIQRNVERHAKQDPINQDKARNDWATKQASVMTELRSRGPRG